MDDVPRQFADERETVIWLDGFEAGQAAAWAEARMLLRRWNYLWSNIDVRGPGECWLWTRSVDRQGYGRGSLGAVHRVAYESRVGPIPEGMSIDHLCHNWALLDGTCEGGPTCLHRRCCNPAHLAPVAMGENARRSHAARRVTQDTE